MSYGIQNMFLYKSIDIDTNERFQYEIEYTSPGLARHVSEAVAENISIAEVDYEYNYFSEQYEIITNNLYFNSEYTPLCSELPNLNIFLIQENSNNVNVNSYFPAHPLSMQYKHAPSWDATDTANLGGDYDNAEPMVYTRKGILSCLLYTSPSPRDRG